VSFAARMHTGSSAPATGVQSLGSIVLDGATPSSQNRGASLTLNANGTISFTNTMADPVYSSVPTNWYLPTTTAIGAGYRVRFTLQSGNAWDAGLTSGTLYTLDAARTIGWTLVPTGSVTAAVLVEIMTTGSTAVLGSGTLNVSLVSDF
jgi:hypothetical protein